MIALALALAAVVGFAIQKGGLCAVRAVREVLDERKVRRFLAFFVCIAVIVALTGPMRWAGALAAEPVLQFQLATATIIGAAVFGIGAVVNGTCAFGSIAHLGRGETSFLARLPGLAAGFLSAERSGPPARPTPLDAPHALAAPTTWALTAVGAALAAALLALWRLWQERSPAFGSWARLSRERWPPQAAAALIGVAGAFLYGTHGSWAYTEGLHRACLMAERIEAALLDVGVFAALLVGSAAGAALQRALILRPPTLRQMIRSFFGGALMGFGGAGAGRQRCPGAKRHAESDCSRVGRLCGDGRRRRLVSFGLTLAAAKVRWPILVTGWRKRSWRMDEQMPEIAVPPSHVHLVGPMLEGFPPKRRPTGVFAWACETIVECLTRPNAAC
jgi:uncharacterized membrane protein YedE/YeeE